MIYELSTHLTRPGRAPEVARLIHEALDGHPGSGVLEAHWTSEIGALNQVLTLRRHADHKERARAASARWADGDIQKRLVPARELILREELKIMRAIVPLQPPGSPSVYEMRTYRLRPGAQGTWLELFTGALPARERHSRIVGLFATEAGQVDEVCHIWAYRDLVERARARDAAAADPDWRRFLGRSRELQLVQEMANAILLPAAPSPMR